MRLNPFEHTAYEKSLWRGWLKNGQSLEISWPSHSVGIRLLIHSNDADQGDRMLNVSLWLVQAFIPLGISRREYTVGEEPSWGVEASCEFGFTLNWGHWRKNWSWPFHRFTQRYEYKAVNGMWVDTGLKWRVQLPPEELPAKETYPYRYVLRSGELQEVNATVHRLRRVVARHILHHFGWPKKTTHEIEVSFDGEVGEGAGSWKGGTVGCGYEMQPLETMRDTLKRMESERTFR